MATYPKRKDKFVAWSKAMVEGATIDKPSYPGTSRKTRGTSAQPVQSSRRRRRRRKKKRMLNA